MTLFVKQVEEQQLLLGNGAAPNLQGFVASARAIGTYARGTDDCALAIFKAANGVAGFELPRSQRGRHPSHELADDQDRQGQPGPVHGRRAVLRQLRRSAGTVSASQFSAGALWEESSDRAAGVFLLVPPGGAGRRHERNQMDELNEDQQGLVATTISYGPFPPKPEYLPQGHRLYERGWFDIGLTDERVVFSLSTQGVIALELGIPLGEAREVMN